MLTRGKSALGSRLGAVFNPAQLSYGRNGLTSGRLVIAAALAGLCCTPTSAQVVIDGTTSTAVTINGNGSVTVGVAPTGSNGVSYNRYERFNVPEAGLELDNRSVTARTIVNEVTGTSQTSIKGPVEVLGQRAHVLVANPNGIVIDGGRFVNTGRVALTTGQLSTNALQIAPGIFQENVVSTVNRGKITIEGGGLSGQMDAVHLIAHAIQVDGPVTNDSALLGSSLNLSAGSTRTEFDSAILPGNTLLNWATTTGASVSSEGKVLVEINRLGVLRSNRIQIEVSDQGAGVRYAGQGFATARGFVLRADGHVDLSGANISTMINSDDTAEDVFTGVSVDAGSLTLDAASLIANGSSVSLSANDATADGISGQNTTLRGTDLFVTSETDLRFSRTAQDESLFQSTSGDIILQAKGGLEDRNGRYTSARNLLISADQNLSFSDTGLSSTAGALQLDTRGHLSANGVVANAFGNAFLTADAITLSNSTRQTEFTATNGSLIITTLGQASNGNLLNRGGLLQGGTRLEGVADSAGTSSEGAVTLNIAGDLINETGSEIALIFGGAGDVSIRTGGDIRNNRGRILANGDVKLVAQGDVLNMVDAPNGTIDPEIVEYTTKGRRQWWTLWVKRKRTSFVSYDYGTLENPDRLATITGARGVRISASGKVVNQGGTINANNGDLHIDALRVETIGLGSGKVYVQRVCVLSCSYTGDGEVTYYGGRLNASDDVKITAKDQFHNRGGVVFALGDVEITSDDVVLEAALVPTLVRRPAGLYNFWASKAAWIYLRDQFGAIIADTGNIKVNSGRPVRIVGGSLTAGGDVDLQNGQDIVREPDAAPGAFGNTIGFLSNAPLVRQ